MTDLQLPIPLTPEVDHPDVTGVPSGQPSPLVAVCGLCGGAGVTTLTYLLGRAAAEGTDGPVLVCDTGGPTAALALYAGVQAPRTLGAAARTLERGAPLTGGLFAETSDRLRVIATPADDAPDEVPTGLDALLHQARLVHTMTVVDCGTGVRPVERQVLASASHVAWMLPASASAARRGEQRLALTPRPAYASAELIVARREPHDRRATLRALEGLAAARPAPLALVPHVPDVLERGAAVAMEVASVSLAALLGAVVR